jgi:hypothetical protein
MSNMLHSFYDYQLVDFPRQLNAKFSMVNNRVENSVEISFQKAREHYFQQRPLLVQMINESVQLKID